jgi:hypothetical protein
MIKIAITILILAISLYAKSALLIDTSLGMKGFVKGDDKYINLLKNIVMKQGVEIYTYGETLNILAKTDIERGKLLRIIKKKIKFSDTSSNFSVIKDLKNQSNTKYDEILLITDMIPSKHIDKITVFDNSLDTDTKEYLKDYNAKILLFNNSFKGNYYYETEAKTDKNIDEKRALYILSFYKKDTKIYDSIKNIIDENYVEEILIDNSIDFSIKSLSVDNSDLKYIDCKYYIDIKNIDKKLNLTIKNRGYKIDKVSIFSNDKEIKSTLTDNSKISFMLDKDQGYIANIKAKIYLENKFDALKSYDCNNYGIIESPACTHKLINSLNNIKSINNREFYTLILDINIIDILRW